jgi:hypothetical protein
VAAKYVLAGPLIARAHREQVERYAVHGKIAKVITADGF